MLDAAEQRHRPRHPRRPRRVFPHLASLAVVCVTSAATIGASTRASGQSVDRHQIAGLAYDSLGKRPLSGAFIAVNGTSRSAVSDDKGRFLVDSVPAGTYTVTMQHAVLDSIGLTGTTARVTIGDRTPRVVLAIPSFATLWRNACGTIPAPADSTLLYGTVRDARSLEPGEGVTVDVSWVDLTGGGASIASIGQRRWRRTVSTDARGAFALCGVPTNTTFELRAALAADEPTTVTLEPSVYRVRRQDLLITRPVAAAFLMAGDSAAAGEIANDASLSRLRGVVSGVITNSGGVPVPNAAVAVDTMTEVRTGDDGRFRISGVRPGTRQLVVVAIGMKPHTQLLNVYGGDTARVVVPMTSVQTLAEVNVRAKANTVFGMRELAYEEHKRLGIGDFRDSTAIAQSQSVAGALRTIAGLEVRGSPYRFFIVSNACGPGFRLVVDGHPLPIDELPLIDNRSIAVMEVYKRRAAPSDVPGSRGCLVMIWTKGALGK